MDAPQRRALIATLASQMAAGDLDAEVVLPVIRTLAAEDPQLLSPEALRQALEAERSPDLTPLMESLWERQHSAALKVHEAKRAGRVLPEETTRSLGGLPLGGALGWAAEDDPQTVMRQARALLGDRLFLAEHPDAVSSLVTRVEERYRAAAEEAVRTLAAWGLEVPFVALRERVADTAPQGRVEEWKRSLEELEQRAEGTRQRRLRDARETLGALPVVEKVLTNLGAHDEAAMLDVLRQRFHAAKPRERRWIIDLLALWPNRCGAAILADVAVDEREGERAALILTTRFGHSALRRWEDWWAWLRHRQDKVQARRREVEELAREHAGELLELWFSLPENGGPKAGFLLRKWCRDRLPPVDRRDFIARWSDQVVPANWDLLLPPPEAVPAPPEVVPASPEVASEITAAETVTAPDTATAPDTVATPAPAPPPEPLPTPSTEPPPPSVWRDHLRPFFVEQWYLVAGVAMVLAGSSLLAYYTWDKHWLLRYTIMPALLAGFTAALAAAGTWVEKQADQFADMATILRGAAIALLPINFMAVALLSSDEQVADKALAVTLMAALYLTFFGWGLRRWCGAVHPALATLLGGALLLLDSLVVLGPLARAVARLDDRHLPIVLGVGFHLGFVVLAAATLRFSRRVLNAELAAEKRVPWFFGITLALTFLQVFVWVHGFIRHLPQPQTYAAMVILTGWLILVVERRALELGGKRELHGGESFLGFALIFLGLLMGIADPGVRILSLVLAGGVWLYQNLARRHPLHDWIGLTLLALAGASVGLLEGFEATWWPGLGIATALAIGVLGHLLRTRVDEEAAARLGGAVRGVQMVILLLSAVVAALVQWHEEGAPLITAGYLLAIAAAFAWRAQTARDQRWLHTAMAILALALPYLGFAEMQPPAARGNVLTFGLGLVAGLWLVLGWWRKPPLVLAARSTVLFLYGSLAVAALVLRILAGSAPPPALGALEWMDLTGPWLMAAALAFATYYSRSLIPAAMGWAILVLLFPALAAELDTTSKVPGWGSGMGSAAAALGIILLCFPLRRAGFLRRLGEEDLGASDRYLDRVPFPGRRLDHRLFIWPLIAAAVFLILKTETWLLLRNLLSGIGLPTAVAVGLTGAGWTLLGVYYRHHRSLAPLGTHLGWLWALGAFALAEALADSPHWSHPFLATGLLLQGLYWLYRYGLVRRHSWAEDQLLQPTLLALRYGSLLLSLACLGLLWAGAEPRPLLPLMIFLAVQLGWHGLVSRRPIYGTHLFLLLLFTLLAATAPGTQLLPQRLSIALSVAPLLGLLLAVQVVHLLMEGRESLYQRWRPLLYPAMVGASLLALVLAWVGLVDALGMRQATWELQTLLLAVLLVTARAHASSPMVLLAAVLADLLIHFGLLEAAAGAAERGELLLSPWRFSLWALGLAGLGHAGSWIAGRPAGRRWLQGAFALPWLSSRSADWLFWPAAGAACLAALHHTVGPDLRASAVQLWAPYLGAATLGLVLWSKARSRSRVRPPSRAPALGAAASWLSVATVVLVALGNIHTVRFFLGDLLAQRGLSEIHLLCLGLAATLLMSSIARLVLRGKAAATIVLNRSSLALAAGVLVLLSTHYFTHPDLQAISTWRFVISGTMALLAGVYFRRAARQPGRGEEDYVDLTEGLYHFGLTIALWSAALLMPALRQPATALVALGLPVLYFYAMAEIELRAGRDRGRRYRHSAALLGFVILGLYVFRSLFHLVAFPEIPIPLEHYHANAPFIMLLAVVLLRLRGLGGTGWLAFYGGLALVAGSYFTLTALPGLSPFHHPVAGAWCAVLLGHFWTLVTHQRSPLQTAIRGLADLDLEAWTGLRRSWGRSLLWATQAVVWWGVAAAALGSETDTHMVAPLLLGGASILIHHGVLRRSAFHYAVAGLEILLALHADFFLPSYLPADAVLWVVLVLWGTAWAVLELLPRPLDGRGTGAVAAALSVITLGHVLYHHPGSVQGLWGMALGALFAAWTPRAERRAGSAAERWSAGALLWTPAWLVYFSQVGTGEAGALVEARPLLALAAALLLTGSAGRWFQKSLAATHQAWEHQPFRLFDQTLTSISANAGKLQYTALWLAFIVATVVQAFHYSKPFAPVELHLVLGLHACLAAAWYVEGRSRESMIPWVLLQASVLLFFAAARRQLMLVTDFWNYEYDVWASLAVSFGLAGAREILARQPRQVRIPFLFTFIALPAVALIWVLIHRLGVDVALMVVGLYSLIFAYMGKDERESPYHLAAVAGFVSFVVMTFWTKLELRFVHAYTLPVGLGVLVLLRLFEKRIERPTRHRIRLFTLLVMLGSMTYYALLDERYPVIFHLTLIVTSLLAMALGGLLRVRLYLTAGFAALLVDLLSLVYQALVQMERTTRMTLIGSVVLALGVALVFGAAYYKTHQQELNDQAERWRRRFTDWE